MDIVLVTYNSQCWLKDCLQSLEHANGLYHDDLNVYIVDNGSGDNTVHLLKEAERNYNFKTLKVVFQTENVGFSRANNIGASLGDNDIICFLNVDTTVYEDTFVVLQKEIEQSENRVAAWEMRQLPYEHPKIYDPVSRETSWMTGAAFAIRRNVFFELNGFEEKFFMYAEDVDLSWRIRALGYCIKYCPKVKINHFAYKTANEIKPLQYIQSLKNNLLLRYRFGSVWDIVQGHFKLWFVILFYKEPFLGAKRDLFRAYVNHWRYIQYFWKTRIIKKNVGKFLEWDYEIVRDGSFCEAVELKERPKVSIIVRTCQRPDVLREALISIRNQTYGNIEVIVVEDGKPEAEEIIENDFDDLKIKYMSTGAKKGRSYAGNLALSNATGDYINFLDDDDLFFADHVETLVYMLTQTDKLAAYAYGLEISTVTMSTSPYRYRVAKYNKRYRTKFDAVELCYHNYIPIQCIMFSRKLYEKYGGFDTKLNYLEDWDLWLRYAQGTEFACVEKTTSIYKVPANHAVKKERQAKLDVALQNERKKQESYLISVNAARLAKYGNMEERGIKNVIANSIGNLWKSR